jgi:hypothetical protein
MWFDLDKAEWFNGDYVFDGRNNISVNTGTQWEHQTLYRTAKGKWVMHHTSDWHGARASWSEVTAEDAAAWLILNKESAAADKYFPKEVAASEI